MVVSDAPDYQRAVVAPQQLVNTSGGGGLGLIELPANAETLILHNPGGVETLDSVVGVGTGTYYPFVALPISPGSPAGSVYLCLVAPAIDSAVLVSGSGSGVGWYAVADASAR